MACREIVDHVHLMPAREQAANEMVPDEASAAGYDCPHTCASVRSRAIAASLAEPALRGPSRR